MKKDTNVQLMDGVLSGITQTKEWETIQSDDPMIVAASARLEKALSAIKDSVSKEQFNELTEAAVAFASASDHAAILFGMHTAFAVQDVAARPADLSKYILQRMNGGAK